jgi:nitroimidazol reductase NimA-like FMN-containing flavoprotein (pyridoxamine 5'-phosphate oxidase superfamily)
MIDAMTPVRQRTPNGRALQPTTFRATIRSHPERSVPDSAPAILAAGLVAHVGFEVDGQPYVIPMAYHYDPAEPRRIYLHAAKAARLIARLEGGEPVCVTVTIVDGLVYSRTAKHHSMNYRSVVCFARAAADTGDRAAVLEGMVTRYFPGREPGRDYEAAPRPHLEATGFIALEIEEWSAKMRKGGPTGPRDQDPDAPGSAGVIPVRAS